MEAATSEAFARIANYQVVLALLLVFIVGLLLIELRAWIQKHPRMGTLAGTLLVAIGIALARLSAWSPDAQILMLSGLMALGIAVIASLLHAPVLKQAPTRQDRSEEFRVLADLRLGELKKSIDDVRKRNMPELHRELKLEELFEQLERVVSAIERIEERSRRDDE